MEFHTVSARITVLQAEKGRGPISDAVPFLQLPTRALTQSSDLGYRPQKKVGQHLLSEEEISLHFT